MEAIETKHEMKVANSASSVMIFLKTTGFVIENLSFTLIFKMSCKKNRTTG